MSFAILLVIFLSSAVFNAYTIQVSEGIISRLYEEKDPSVTLLNDFKMIVSRSRELSTNWVYLVKNEEGRQEMRQIMDESYPVLKHKLNKMAERWDQASQDSLSKAFTTYEQIQEGQQEIMRNLSVFEDYENPLKLFAAEEKLEFHVLPLSNGLVGFLDTIIEQKNEDKSLAREELVENNRYIRISIVASGVVTLIISVVISILTAIRVTTPVVKAQKILESIGNGILPESISHNSSDEIGKMIKSINRLVDGLKRTSLFAQEIGEGKLDTHYEPLGKEDVLGNALLSMRDNLQKVKLADEHRHWANEGYARFMEMLRTSTDDFEKLGYSLISELVKYLNANQGGFFIVHQENSKEQYLKLIGCYAWDRRKYVEKKILYGEGQLGQVWREGDTVLLTDIPDDYIHITSGLGKSNPRAIMMVPLRFKDEVYGVIEIASFTPFKEHEIEFVERLSESVASTISNISVNQRTQKLLRESQEQSEKLRIKDEEMRQNMEEMRATQEQSQRREQELIEKIAELESDNSTEHK